MANVAQVHRLANGLTLIGEPMPWLRSTAFTLLVPAGTNQEADELAGQAGITVELCQRGAGDFDSRQIVEELDLMGVERSCATSTFHTSFSVATVSDSLPKTLGIYAAIVRFPHLPDDEMEESRLTALQEWLSVEDDPSQKVFTELKKLRYGRVHGRSPYGTREGIEATSWEDVRLFHQRHYRPQGSILSVAGAFEWERLKDEVETLFGDWEGQRDHGLEPVEVRTGHRHLPHDSSQTHMALAYECVPYQHPEFYHSRGLVSVLSDGMSSRLFTEVREKRGLVYSISASCQTLGNRGSVLTYAGTTGGRAQETLDVTIETIESLGGGVTPGELNRLKARVKSSLVMEQESSSARSSQMATDWYFLGRVVPRDEVLSKIESLTCDALLEHYREHPPRGWSLITMGPEEVELKHAI